MAVWKSKEHAYEQGKSFAKEVQEGLENGDTFGDHCAINPEEAMSWTNSCIEELGYNDEYTSWWRGYLSAWD